MLNNPTMSLPIHYKMALVMRLATEATR